MHCQVTLSTLNVFFFSAARANCVAELVKDDKSGLQTDDTALFAGD